jgi:hypothetical protein
MGDIWPHLFATKRIPLIRWHNNNRCFAGFAVINQQLTTGCHHANDRNCGDGEKSIAHVFKPFPRDPVQGNQRQNAMNIYRII